MANILHILVLFMSVNGKMIQSIAKGNTLMQTSVFMMAFGSLIRELV